MPPATQATVPRKSSGLPGIAMCVGLPSGPATLENASPSSKLLGHLDRGLADGLNDQRDRSPFAIRRRRWSAGCARSGGRPHHDELAGPVAPGDPRRLDLEKGDVFAERLLDQNPKAMVHLGSPPSKQQTGRFESCRDACLAGRCNCIILAARGGGWGLVASWS